MNGKKVGSQFEREICKELSLWLSKGERDDVFWRSAMSGGRATIGAKVGNKRVTQVGDISAIHNLGFKLTKCFAVELKRYRDLGLANFILGRKCKLLEFWLEICKKAKEHKRLPMLIAKQVSGKIPEIIIIDMQGMVKFRPKPGCKHIIYISNKGKARYIFLLRDFMQAYEL